jgi:exonuclease SbcC
MHVCSLNIQKLEQFQTQFLEKKMLLEKELDNYARGEREFAVKKVKFEALEEKKRKRELLELELDKINLNSEAIRKRVDDLAVKLKESSGKKKEVNDAKSEFERIREAKSFFEKEIVKVKAKAQFNTRIVKQLEEEVEKMKTEEAKLNKLKSRRAWIEDDFLNLVDTIEKKVLAKIYSEFNSFFQEWFNTLIEDETISVKLDDSFTPLIEQNGYETNLENLSGGEKTSVALAYRLALNKVINDFMSSVKTRDLIILDEPTEGFSTEQLDRVREVLNQSKVIQTIIVSHETKMEGFVDHVIRVQKKNHTSTILVTE